MNSCMLGFMLQENILPLKLVLIYVSYLCLIYSILLVLVAGQSWLVLWNKPVLTWDMSCCISHKHEQAASPTGMSLIWLLCKSARNQHHKGGSSYLEEHHYMGRFSKGKFRHSRPIDFMRDLSSETHLTLSNISIYLTKLLPWNKLENLST